MNLELLKKLVLLANHNPNDYEANSAARKVCQIIEECKFDFREDINQQANQQYPSLGNINWGQQAASYTQQQYQDMINFMMGKKK